MTPEQMRTACNRINSSNETVQIGQVDFFEDGAVTVAFGHVKVHNRLMHCVGTARLNPLDQPNDEIGHTIAFKRLVRNVFDYAKELEMALPNNLIGVHEELPQPQMGRSVKLTQQQTLAKIQELGEQMQELVFSLQ